MTIKIPSGLQATQEYTENDSGVDDLLDMLPAALRRKVLATTHFTEEEEPAHKPWSWFKRVAWWLALTLALVWSAPWLLVTLALVVSILGAPIAVVTWAIGSGPAALLIEAKIKAPTERPWKRV